MVAVHVLIDLHWQKAVGGHVKSWMQFASIAQTLDPETIDLTLHLHGDRPETIPQSANVRYVTHPPRFSTERLPFLQDVPSHTDLASHAPSLLPYLEQADVVHTTHPLFTFGQTAQKYCTAHQKPLVSSIHTDSALYAKIYLEEKLQKIFGVNGFSRLLNQQLRLPERYKNGLDQKQTSYWKSCAHVWYSQPSEQAALIQNNPELSISRLRRGVNLEMFSPTFGDRTQLFTQYNVPKDPFLLLFVGRLDACKNFTTFAHTLQILLDQGLNVHGVAAGRGSQADRVRQQLGQNITFLGNLPHAELGLIYASCDLFVFPSETETVGNVVLEAKASGLVPLVSDQGGVTQLIQRPGEDGFVIPGQDPRVWAKAVQTLYGDKDRRSQMSQAAHAHLQETWPTWDTVFREDLLPIWQAMV